MSYSLAVFVVIAGPSASGKTTVSTTLAAQLGAMHLSVDCVVEGLLTAGMDPDLRTAIAAYEAVRVLAQHAIQQGRDVIVDAVSDAPWGRDIWASTARNLAVASVLIALHVPDHSEHRRRLDHRSRPFSHIPEISWERLMIRMTASPDWPEEWQLIDASGTPEAVLREIAALLPLRH